MKFTMQFFGRDAFSLLHNSMTDLQSFYKKIVIYFTKKHRIALQIYPKVPRVGKRVKNGGVRS